MGVSLLDLHRVGTRLHLVECKATGLIGGLSLYYLTVLDQLCFDAFDGIAAVVKHGAVEALKVSGDLDGDLFLITWQQTVHGEVVTGVLASLRDLKGCVAFAEALDDELAVLVSRDFLRAFVRHLDGGASNWLLVFVDDGTDHRRGLVGHPDEFLVISCCGARLDGDAGLRSALVAIRRLNLNRVSTWAQLVELDLAVHVTGALGLCTVFINQLDAW